MKIGAWFLKRTTRLPRTNATVREIDWSIGFLEGEGSFVRGNSHTVSAGQKNKEPLERLVRAFGGRISRRTKSRLWFWQVSGAQARGVMMTLYGGLTRRRKRQIRKALYAVA